MDKWLESRYEILVGKTKIYTVAYKVLGEAQTQVESEIDNLFSCESAQPRYPNAS